MEEDVDEKLILDSVKEVFGKVPVDEGMNLILFAKECNRNLVDFLYIFKLLEKNTGVPVAEVLEKRSYIFLSIKGLKKAIIEDFVRIRAMQ